MFLALSLVAAYIENLIPIQVGVPGVKLGLANIVTMVILYTLGFVAAALLSAARIRLSGMLFGRGFAMVSSAAGAVSVAGGVFHNVGQILVAMAVLETGALLYYLPILVVSGLAAGIVTGIISGILIKRVAPVFRENMM